MKRLLTITVLAILALTTGDASAAVLKPITGGGGWHSSPIFATAPKDDSRVFVVERGDSASHTANIRIVEDGVLQPEPFLTVPNVDVFSERGLLSMAFAPDYATSGLFYVFWVAREGDGLNPASTAGNIRIVEFRRSAFDRDVADPASARLVLETPHSAGNHNGGWIGFGPDGYLYFTIGDNNNRNNAPMLGNLYGKLMRIDPSDPDGPGPQTRTIPADNPFVADPDPGTRDEIFTRGLRNPYRSSFAPNGDLAIADVGELDWEEVNVGDFAGLDLGWPDCEGGYLTGGFTPCAIAGKTNPFFSYRHQYGNPNPAPGTGNVIIGGYVVRDPDLTGLNGRYLYGDGARSDLRTINLSVPGGDPVDPGLSISTSDYLFSFGEDSLGCIYVMTNNGAFRVAANSTATADCPHEAEVPEPPVPPVDSTRPGLELSGKNQNLGKKIAFFATCDEACSIYGKGSLKAKRRGKKKAVGFRFSRVSTSAATATKVKVVLRLKPKALKNARRVARGGRRLRATLIATAADPSDNRRTKKLHLKIKPLKAKR